MSDDEKNQELLRNYLRPGDVLDANAEARLEREMKAIGLPITPGAVANLISNPFLKEARAHIASKIGDKPAAAAGSKDETFRHVYASRSEAEASAADFRLAGCTVKIEEVAPNRWVLTAVCPPRADN